MYGWICKDEIDYRFWQLSGVKKKKKKIAKMIIKRFFTK